MLILVMIKGGASADWLRWTFVAIVTIWVAIAVIKGLIGKAGPKLRPATRAAYPWMHRAIYGALTVSAALNAAELLGWMTAGPAWVSLLVLLAIGAFHGLFQFWRHTALYDNALLLITPKFMHKFL
jgi:cytochrome b561